MTERDPDSGQFISDHYAAEHSKLEFTPLADDKPREEDGPTYGSSDDEIRRAAAEMQERRGVQTEEAEAVTWFARDTGEPLDPNISTTRDQAATALADYREARDAAAQEAQDRDLKAAIDNPRIELEVTDPSTAAKYEFKHEIHRAVDEFARDMGVETPPAATVETSTQPAPDGLDGELARALAHPQVREAVEAELARAYEAKAGYEAKVNEANNWARASLVHEFPELGRLPVEQWENALMTVQAQDPVRFQKGVGVINQVQRVSAEQARIANEHAARAQQLETARQQQLADWSRSEAERYDRWAAKEAPRLRRVTSKAISVSRGISSRRCCVIIRCCGLQDSNRFSRTQFATARSSLPSRTSPGKRFRRRRCGLARKLLACPPILTAAASPISPVN
jgi:hypothetical protein